MQDRLDPVWDQIERIERDMALAQRRNEPGAVRRARQALEALDQEHPGVQMFLADLLVQDHQPAKAIELYKKALERSPGDKEIETKMANAVLAEAGDFGMANFSEYETVASAKTNLVLSIILPGLGQVVSGQTKKGAIMMGSWLICLFLAILVPGGLAGFAGLFGIGRESFNPMVLLPLFGMGLVFAISWGDMAGQAKKVMPDRKRRVEHPTPPVDKDFEIKL